MREWTRDARCRYGVTALMCLTIAAAGGLAWLWFSELLGAAIVFAAVVGLIYAVADGERRRRDELAEALARQRREAQAIEAAHQRGAECLQHVGVAATTLLNAWIVLGRSSNPLDTTIEVSALANGERISVRSLADAQHLEAELYWTLSDDLGGTLAALAAEFDRTTTRWTADLESARAQLLVEKIVADGAKAAEAARSVWSQGNEFVGDVGELQPAFAVLGGSLAAVRDSAEELERMSDPQTAAQAARERQDQRDQRRRRQQALQASSVAAATRLLADCIAGQADAVAIRSAHSAFIAATPDRDEMHERTARAVQALQNSALAVLTLAADTPSRIARGGTVEQADEDHGTALKFLKGAIDALGGITIR